MTSEDKQPKDPDTSSSKFSDSFKDTSKKLIFVNVICIIIAVTVILILIATGVFAADSGSKINSDRNYYLDIDDFNRTTEPTPTEEVPVTYVPTPVPTPEKIFDAYITPIDPDIPSELFNKTYTFPYGYSQDVALSLSNIAPTTYIRATYMAKEVTETKGYTDTQTKDWTEIRVQKIDPNALFEIHLYNSKGELIASEGYAGKYPLIEVSELKILGQGDYIVEFTGRGMGVFIEVIQV